MQQSYERDARTDYERAYKLGQKDYKAHISKGDRGTLLVLDQMVEQNRIMAYVKRPQTEISLSRVVGTYTSSRGYSFSTNFMPLHPDGSEFASKWITLCAAHMEEGLRDPIQVYEYMWNYYVVEGNKRVSVLKYFDAPTVRAEITRLIPQLDPESPDTAVYYAFLQYDKKGLFKGIHLSSAEKYRQLSELEEKLLASDAPTEEVNYNTLYLQFSAACVKAKITLFEGDVLLEYIKLYGMPYETTISEMTAAILALQPQLELIEQPQTEPTLVLDPQEEAPVSFVQRLFNPRRTAHVLFAYEAGRTDHNWIGAHEKGRRIMQAELGDRVVSEWIDDLTVDNFYDEINQHGKGKDLVLVTSSRFATSSLRFALENPDTMTLLYSRVRQDSRMSTYYGRYYEVVFLCGIAAGFATRSGKVAYITPQTEKRFTADINAFGLGVKTVNPNARVMLIQRGVSPSEPESCRIGIREAANKGADVVLSPVYSGLELPGMPGDVFSMVMSIHEDGTPKDYLAAPSWDWGRYYTELVKSYLNNSLDILKYIDRNDVGVAGLWWGIGTGVLKFHMADVIHPTANNLVRYLRGSIGLGRFNPFHGPVFDQNSVLRVPMHSDPKPYDILNMDWIADFIRIID